MQLAKQLAIFLDNRPGTLARITAEFAMHKVNILVISISDSVDHCVLRVVVDDTDKAIHLLEEHGVLVVEREVILIEGGARPGELARMAAKLAANRINIEYTYGAVAPGAKKGLLAMRTSDNKRTIKLLNR
ncbi:MAG: ACT domain-containing protein [Verrucomicrobiae bacterium]|nr:ACT domain-containing protein [Verrucomicrobiae bacterium]